MPVIQTTLFEKMRTESVPEGRPGKIATQYMDPTDLEKPADVLASALGSCMMTMVGAVAAKRQQDLTGSRLETELVFDDKHSHVTQIKLAFTFPDGLTPEVKTFYANVAQTCPVHNSLRKDIVYTITIK